MDSTPRLSINLANDLVNELVNEPATKPAAKPATSPSATARPSLPRLGSAVLWSFFGVRKRRNMEADLAHLSPVHVVIAGIIGAAAFVLFLLTLVHTITA